MLSEDELARVLARPADALDALDRIDCEESLLSFARRMWPILEPGRPLVEGWPLEAMAEHLEAVTNGQIQKLLINVPPGFMKSLLVDVIHPAWEWGPRNLPSMRYVAFSYSADLTERDNRRFRDIMLNHDYGRLFGDKFALMKTGESLVSNDKTGWKLASSVGGVGTGERGDRVVCFPASTLVATDRGRLPIGDVVRQRLPAQAWSYNQQTGQLELKPITGWHTNPGDRLIKLTLDDGSSLVCTVGHRILTSAGYVRASDLSTGDLLHAAFSRVLVAPPPVAISERQVEMRPNAPSSDAANGADAHPKFVCKNLRGVVVTVGDLANEFLSQVTGAIFEGPVPLAVGDILSSRPIFDIHQARVGPVPVFVPHLLTYWARSKERFRHQLVRHAVKGLAALAHSDARIPLDKYWSEDAARYRQGVPSTADCAWDASNAAKIGDLVNPLNSERRPPFLARLISIEDGGHADETFCLTVAGNHNMAMGSGEQVIICSNCDDPHNVKESESDTVRQETVRWFRESMSSRLNDAAKSSVIVIMQRVHEEDVSGVILSEMRNDYEHLMIPLEWEGNRMISTVPQMHWNEDPRTHVGELAWPARFAPKEVRNLKIALGPYATAGQLQQTPSPRGGGIFKRDWWQLWGNPDDPDDARFKRFPTCEFVVASLDGAFGQKQENDYTALTIWGVFRDATATDPKAGFTRRVQGMQGRPKIILMHAWKKRLPLQGPQPPPQEPGETVSQYRQRCQPFWGIVEWVMDSCSRFKVDRLLIEAKANGIDVANQIQILNSGESWGTQLIDPGRLDKVSRAYSVQHLLADAMIYAPDREWADDVITELSVFPKTAHDDYTDATCQAWKFLRDIGLAAHGHEIERDFAEQLAYKPAVTRPLYPV